MSRKMLTGSFVALITPFNKDGSVDFGAFRTLLKFQEDRGTSAVLIMARPARRRCSRRRKKSRSSSRPRR